MQPRHDPSGKASRRAAKNGSALLAAQVFDSLTGLVAIRLATGYLSATGSGEFVYVFAFCTAFQALTDLGVNQIVIREIAKDKSAAPGLLRAAFRLRAVAGVLTVLAMIVTAMVAGFERNILQSICLLGLSTIFSFSADIYSAVFQGHEKMEYTAVCIAIRQSALVAFTGLFVNWDLGLPGIYAAYLAASIIEMVTGFAIYSLNFRSCPSGLKNKEYSYTSLDLLKESYAVGLSNIGRKLSFRIDTLILEKFVSMTQVGYFGLAYRMVNSLIMIPRVASSAVFPIIARRAGKSQNALSRAYDRSFGAILATGLGFSLALYAFSPLAVSLVLGPRLAPAVPAVRALSWVVGLVFTSTFLIGVLNACGRQKRAVEATYLALVVNIVIDLALIPSMGFMGACWGTLAGESTLVIACLYAVRKDISLPVLPQQALKAFLAGTAVFPLLSLVVTQTSSQALPALILTAYASLVMAVGAVRHQDFMRIVLNFSVKGASTNRK